MARMIVRYSFGSGPENVAARNAARNALQDAGLDRTGTGSFEGRGARNDLIDALKEALAAAQTAPTLDHLWIYLDEPEEDEN